MPVFKEPVADIVRFEWRGDRITAQVGRGIREAMVRMAQTLEETGKELVHVDTGALQEDIQATVPRRRGTTMQIVYGSFNIPYAYWQEVLPDPVGKSYIRAAVDLHFWKLEGWIADRVAHYVTPDFDLSVEEEGMSQWGEEF